MNTSENPYKIAMGNFAQFIGSRPYYGRGIIVGLDESGDNIIQIYFVMGRSKNSQNRVLVVKEGSLYTDLADPKQAGDTSLIIYRAMAEQDGMYVVSNGDQTDTVLKFDVQGKSLKEAMATREPEPDEPNYTPRITTVSMLRDPSPSTEFSIVRYGPTGDIVRDLYAISHQRGLGYCVTTYTGDGNPLPSFQGVPYLLPIPCGDIEYIAGMMSGNLNQAYFVALAVRSINLKTGKSKVCIRNRHTQVA